MKVTELRVLEYELVASKPDGVSRQTILSVRLCRVGQLEGPDLWAIRCGKECLNKKGEWEWEPLPSSRTPAFFKRCRWATPEAALAVWDKAQRDGGGR